MTITVVANVQAQRAWSGLAASGATTVLLVNNDILNPVYVGPTASTSAIASDAFPLGPLNTLALPANQDIWVATANGATAQVFVLPDGTDWSPSPAQIAAQLNTLGLAKDASVNALPSGVAATGVPLLTRSTLLNQQTSVSLTIGAVSTLGPFNVSQIGYEMILSSFQPTGVLSFFKVELQWSDSVTGAITGFERWWLVPGSAIGSPHVINGIGPTKGDRLTVIITNHANSTGSITYSYTLLQNSRVYAEDKWRTQGFSAAGQSGPGQDVVSNVLASVTSGLAAGAGLSRFLPLYNGTINLMVTSTSNTNDCEVTLNDVADQSIITNPNFPIYDQFTNAQGNLYALVGLPRAQLQLNITNHNAATKTVTAAMIMNEQAVF